MHRLLPFLKPVLKTIPAGILVLAALWLAGCPTSNTHDIVDLSRTPFALHIDTVASDHPFCKEPQPNFASMSECQAAHKFKISWETPPDTTGLIGYRFYLDTNAFGDLPTETKWADIESRKDLADIVVENIERLQDSILFAVGKPGTMPEKWDASSPHLVLIDTTGRFPKGGTATMAIVAVYTSGNSSQQSAYGPVQIGDHTPPVSVQVETQVFATHFVTRWDRPIDAISFFNPGEDTGVIREYHMQLMVTSNGPRAYLRGEHFHPSLVYTVEGDTVKPKDSLPVLDSKGRFIGVKFTLPDSGHFHRQRQSPLQDQISLTVSNLNPLDTLSLQLVALDAVGNSLDLNNATKNQIILTDTTEPEKPQLLLDSSGITRNQLVIRWKASRDSISVDGRLQRAPNPDQGIFQYRIRREWLKDSTIVSKTDSVVAAGGSDSTGFYTDSLFRLPPGTDYRFVLIAIDSTGHPSQADTLLASTPSVAFHKDEAELQCPPGFIPIPGHFIILGDTTSNANAEERPRPSTTGVGYSQTYVSSFCIEPYEHRDSSGAFMPSVSWGQADSICKSLASDSSVQLCSEAQWERACKGGDSLPHIYGYQGDRSDPGLLLGECNQGSGDTLPAMDLALRGNHCLTNEGVFDMPGEFSEWVRDGYDSLAYSKLSKDSLEFGFSFETPPNSGHSIRGGNYLKPNVPTAVLQSLARCTNRDTPRQVRPKFKAECLDSIPKILVQFGSDFNLHRCFAYPERAKEKKVSLVYPALDSIHLIVAYSDTSLRDSVTMPRDSITRGRIATSVSSTTLSLAAVEYIKPDGSRIQDTLDAREFRDTSAAVRRKVINREAGAGNKAYEVDGKPFVKLLYAYTRASSRPAYPDYRSRAISFRCCAKPMPKAKTDSTASP